MRARLPLLLAVAAAGSLAACGDASLVGRNDARFANAHCQAYGQDGYASNPQVACRLTFEAAQRETRRAGLTQAPKVQP